MPRNKPRKTDRVRTTDEDLKAALNKVLNENVPIRTAAEMFKISKSKLFRHLKEANKQNRAIVITPRLVPNQVFNERQEAELETYLITASQLHHGLTTVDARKLAYQFAIGLHLNFPDTWNVNKKAGPDWLFGFLKRHNKLSVRSPEATSLSRATSFNKTNVNKFYTNLSEVMVQYSFEPHRIFNCDETGCTTVQKPPNVIAQKGSKQVGQITSAERGKLVTVCCFINAAGNTLPPSFVFPRATLTNFLLNGAPHGSLMLVHKSGWMTGENFFLVMKHFVKHTLATKENPVLMLLDNHESHVSIETIDFAKQHGVVMLTFPPHCSHKLQPLDVSVYGPFKGRYNTALNNWMISNPGKTVTYYQIPSLVNEAFIASMIPKNILSGFSATGIFPFNKDNFTNKDFSSSYVTDRPDPTILISENSLGQQDQDPSLSPNYQSSSVNCCRPIIESSPICKHVPVTPELIRPYPKAAVRKLPLTHGRKKGSTSILTKTPEKLQREQQAKQKVSNYQKSKKSVAKAKKLKLSDDTTESSNDCSELDLSSDKSEMELLSNKSVAKKRLILKELMPNDFVLVMFTRKQSIDHYVGIIDEINHVQDEALVSYLKKKSDTWKFFYPEKEDRYWVDSSDIILKLPKPQIDQTTMRASSLLSFVFNFSNYNVR